jgi:lysozyme
MMTSADRAELRTLIMACEGYRRKPYHCTAGKLTVGYGRNLDDVGIDQEEARYLLDRDINKVILDLALFPWFESLDAVRQRALINMQFQLGLGGFHAFQKMLVALAKKDYETAAHEMLDSKWARSDTPARAKAMAEMVRTGTQTGSLGV